MKSFSVAEMGLNPWVNLILAGCFEMGFTTCMKLSDGFTRWPWVAGFLGFAVLSFACLSASLSEIPLGTAYAVWTGLGAFGTAVIGILFFNEPVSAARIILLLLLIASIVGLKAFSNA